MVQCKCQKTEYLTRFLTAVSSFVTENVPGKKVASTIIKFLSLIIMQQTYMNMYIAKLHKDYFPC